MTEKNISDQLKEIKKGDLVVVFYNGRENKIKMKPGYSQYTDVRGILMADEYGYDRRTTGLRPMGDKSVDSGFIAADKILKIEIVKRRSDIRRDLELLLEPDKKSFP
mgnify:CR=1 FL=1